MGFDKIMSQEQTNSIQTVVQVHQFHTQELDKTTDQTTNKPSLAGQLGSGVRTFKEMKRQLVLNGCSSSDEVLSRIKRLIARVQDGTGVLWYDSDEALPKFGNEMQTSTPNTPSSARNFELPESPVWRTVLGDIGLAIADKNKAELQPGTEKAVVTADGAVRPVKTIYYLPMKVDRS